MPVANTEKSQLRLENVSEYKAVLNPDKSKLIFDKWNTEIRPKCNVITTHWPNEKILLRGTDFGTAKYVSESQASR